ELPEENLFLEPAKRDLAAAIGMSFFKLKSMDYTGPIAILWADHLMDNVDEFINALKAGEELIKENGERFIFMGEKPRFANHNLGWITVGNEIDEKNGIKIREFKSWKYRPELEECKRMFESGQCLWNPGYWITSINFVLELYKEHMSDMYDSLLEIAENPDKLDEIYPTLESVHFDNAIVEKTDTDEAVVLEVNLGWSDPGTLYALKEALEPETEKNVEMGQTLSIESKDCLVINQEPGKIVTSIGLEGFVIINTEDAILVVHKDRVNNVKELVNKLSEDGFDDFI
ncbi:MAG: hypothetical protein KDC67_07590, partial [Ignavibacteriae bacterium]|nr:hypothetical protein [Ignavibacteriota bacterium]